MKKKLPTILIVFGMLVCSNNFSSGVMAIDPSGGLIWNKTANPSGGHDEAKNVVIDGSSIYVVGYEEPGNYRWRVEKRSLTDGSIIWKKTINPSSGSDRAMDVAVDGTSIYIVGYDNVKGNSRWRIEKWSTTDGSLIWKKTSNPSSYEDVATSVVIAGSYVYVGGYEYVSPSNYRWRIEKRSTTDGSLIWKKTSNPSSGLDLLYGMATDGSDIYAVGYDGKLGSTNRRWRIEKRSLSDGSRIWVKTVNPSSGNDEAYGITTDGTGVYIVGRDYLSIGNYRWRIEKRDLSTGGLIWKKISNPSSGLDGAHDVDVYGASVYIVGIDEKPGNWRWRIEKRSTTDGSLIWAKGSNPSSQSDNALGVDVDGSSVFVVGYDSRSGYPDTRWRIEKRYP